MSEHVRTVSGGDIILSESTQQLLSVCDDGLISPEQRMPVYRRLCAPCTQVPHGCIGSRQIMLSQDHWCMDLSGTSTS